MSIENIIKNMTLDERAGQLVMSSFTGRTEIPEETVELIKAGAAGSILYFSGCNVVDALQLRGLTEKVQKASLQSKAGLPQFIAIDQEGGQLAPITKGVSIGPGNMALAAIRENGPDFAYKVGNITGKELKAIGIDVCFAPVVDLCFEEGLPVKDNRYFGSDPVKAGVLAAAFTKGLQDAGVMACAKHFPGQRNVDIDSHFELDTVPYTYDQLMNCQWIPFKASIDAGVSMMMTLHASFPELDKTGTPATLSPTILNEYLRGKLGFNGLIVTDDIQMKPIKDKYGIDGALIKAVDAGVNQIIVSGGVWDANKIIADAVRRGELSEDKLNLACARVLEFKEKYVSKTVPTEETAKSLLVTEENIKAIQDAADASITVIKNEGGLLPLTKEKILEATKGTKIKPRVALLRPTYARLMMSDNTNFYLHTFKEVFEEVYGTEIDFCEYTFGLDPSDVEILAASDWAFMADYTILCTYNSYQHPQQQKLLDACYAFTGKEKMVAAILRSPHDLTVIPENVESVMLSYGVAKCSVKALANVIAGNAKPQGALPVGIGNLPRGTGKSDF